ncbi:MAG: sigma-70 family RNA polymerase sigma factor [Acidobacteriota bacterium]
MSSSPNPELAARIDARCERGAIPDEHRPTFQLLVGRRLAQADSELEQAWEAVHEDYADWQSYCAACDGDEVAQTEFYGAWRRRARAYYRQLGVDDDSWEDLFQQFSERLLRYKVRERFQWTSSFRAYCYTMLRRLGTQRQVTWHRRAETELTVDPPTTAPGPDESLPAREEEELLEKAFEQLGDLDRRVLLAFYAEDLSAGAIAKNLGLQPAAVHQRISRARKRLAKLVSALTATPVEERRDRGGSRG